MEILLLDGYLPTPGESFEVLTFASRVGAFDEILGLDLPGELYFVPQYDANGLTLNVTGVPEPTVLVMLAMAACALLIRRRRRGPR